MSNNKKYTLGLDIGIASVGAALLAEDEIIGLHVRTFDKAETAKEGESLNKIRRESRLMRRRLRRKAFRLKRLERLLKRTGLINHGNEDFIVIKTSPWELRSKGLDCLISHVELAKVLYHILKHRGFQSNRKSEVKEDEKAGAMLSGVQWMHENMLTKGYRTIGEMIAKDAIFSNQKRNKGGGYSHTVSRDDLVKEVNLLFSSQRELGSNIATKELETNYLELLLARRPALAGEELLEMVGKCHFETSEHRAPKACYSSERFVYLSKLNNLRLISPEGSRSLTDDEFLLLKDFPFQKTSLSFKQIRQTLSLPSQYTFNLMPRKKGTDEEAQEKTKFFEAKAYHALRKKFKAAGFEKHWQESAFKASILDKLGWALTNYKTDNDILSYLEPLNLPTELLESLLELSFDKHINVSLKLINNILPHLESGKGYKDAMETAGYKHYERTIGQREKYLPHIDKDKIKNPVVFRSLNQSRKMVNAIIKRYGPPEQIHIELARDLSKPFDERNKIKKEQEKYQIEKSEVREQYTETFEREPSGLDLLKWRLYRQQNGQCAYSLKPIDLNRLSEIGYVQIDHILPFSRSFDDSLNNKVLVLTVENQNKGNRTPYEYLDGDKSTDLWMKFETWVKSNPNFKKAKKLRLLRKNFATEAKAFRERNLNDTRYICREFKRMLEDQLQWRGDVDRKQNCRVVAGQMTSLIRSRWGLLKVREDGDLHHALDAAVVAALGTTQIKKMANYSKRRELENVKTIHADPETGEILDIQKVRQMEKDFPAPYNGFVTELKAKLSNNPAEALMTLCKWPESKAKAVKPIRVSRAPRRRSLGSAHQETIRSRGKDDRLLEQNLSAVKKPLTHLTLKNIESMAGYSDPRNLALINLLRERLIEFNGKGDKAFAKEQPPIRMPAKGDKVGPIVRSVKLLETQKSGLKVREGIAGNGDMARIDLFTDGKKNYVVPIYVSDLVAKKLPNKAVVSGKVEEDWIPMGEGFEFVCSIYVNDWLKITLKSKVIEGYFGGFDRSTAAIHIWTHDRNQNIGKNGLLRSIGIKSAVIQKYHIDMLGRLYPAKGESRAIL